MEVALANEIAVQVAEWVWAGVGFYGIVGVVFGAAFVRRGAAKMDHAAKGATWAFRLMIFPGAAALWPVLLRKWMRAGKQEDTENHA